MCWVLENMQVPILDLKSQYRSIRQEMGTALEEVIASQHFVLGTVVEQLEDELVNYLAVKYAIGVASGSDALLLSLMAIGIKPDDEVITTPFTFFATAGAIARLFAKPVFVDIDRDTFNISTSEIRNALNKHKKVKAIIPVHLYGQSADMDEIISLSQQYQILVIEDAAQSIGAVYKTKKTGTIADLGCFSFYPTKNLGGWGDGGLITTNNEKLSKLIKMLRVHGAENKYYHKYIGLNSRLDAIQSAILRVKLKYIDLWNNERLKRAMSYDSLFQKEGLIKYIATPITKPNRNHIYHQYTIRVFDSNIPETRDKLIAFLKQNHIGCEVYYPLPLHLQECFAYLGYKKGDLPIAEKSSLSVLSLPIYPELTDSMQEYVVGKIKDFFKK
jgi:dTDP-4-amino-4,6-dideoxygalactose transaminase